MERTYSSLRQLDHHERSPIRIYPNSQADDYPAHWHRKYEIIMPVEDIYTAVVDNKTYDLVTGDVLVIPAGVVHEIFAPEQGLRYIFMVDQEVILAIEGLAAVQHFFYPCVHLRADREQDSAMLDIAREYLNQAIRERENRDMLDSAAVVAWVSLFLIRLSRWQLRQQKENQGEHRHHMGETFLDVYAYITEHCNEKLTLDDMAAYSGYSKYHFARIFKEYTGMSFYEFYVRQRIILCKQLLGEMNLSVTEVASRAGFGSIATFNRVFKQYEGVTPTQYRQLRQRVLERKMDGVVPYHPR